MDVRLSVIDDMFLRTHRGFGTPILMQGLWRCEDRIDRVDLDALHSNLSVGRLSKRVVSPKVPLARRHWTSSTDALPLEYPDAAVENLVDWADMQCDVDLDPEFGPGWRLTATPMSDGGTVVSLVCSHAVADARGLASAIAQALSGAAADRTTRYRPTSLFGSDLLDAVKLTSTVTFGTTRAIARLAVSSDRRAALRSYRMSPAQVASPDVTDWSAPNIISQISVAEWDASASGAGGSPNSLFIAILAGLARRIGYTEPALGVSVPFETRSAGANAISMAAITVWPDDSLGDIRQSCIQAFAHPVSGPADFPEEILQLVPDALANKLAGSPGERDVLCSNIGVLPDQLEWIGPHRCTGLATRAVHPNLSARNAASSGRWLSAYLSRVGDTYSLTVTGLRPAAIKTRSELRDAVAAELAERHITAQFW